MTNNNFEDLDHNDLGHDETPPPPHGFFGNLKEAWRTRPLFKLIVLLTVIGGIIAASLGLFSGSNQTADNTRLPRPPDLHEAAGGKASPYFVQQTKEAEDERAKQAIANGGSALPTPIGQNTSMEMAGTNAKNDPLNELRAETERLKQQVVQVQQQQQQPKAPPPQQQQQQFDDTLAQAMQRELQQMMDSWKPTGVKDVDVTKLDSTAQSGSGSGANASGNNANAASTQMMNPIPKTLVPAGTVSYGQLLTEANSDIPGPILAQIMSGPLAGARAVGSFQDINDYLVLQFSLVNFKGKDYQLNAVALDPDTTLGGLATDVDPRYFTRVVLPAAAGFMQGLGSALSQGSSSVVTNGTTTIVQQSGKGIQQGMFQGLGQASQAMSQFFENQANNTKTLVRVAAGTPIGIFYVASVQDTTIQQQQQQQQQMMPPYGYQGYQGYPGLPGTTTPGSLPAGYPGYPSQQQPQTGYYNPAATQGASYTMPGASSASTNQNVPYPNPGAAYSPTTSTGIGTATFAH